MGKFIQIDPEGSNTRAYFAEAKGGKGPGVLVCHSWWGLNSFFTGLADRLADEGYTVVAPDLYDGQVASTIADAEALVTASEQDDGKKNIAREQAALDYLLGSPSVEGKGVGAIGCSMGTNYVTWLATLRPEIAAVVVFYGGSDWNNNYAEKAKAPLQGHWASNDAFEANEGSVAAFETALKEAGHTPEFYTYPNTEHWFFESDRPEYSAEASQLAWKRTLAFLKAQLA